VQLEQQAQLLDPQALLEQLAMLVLQAHKALKEALVPQEPKEMSAQLVLQALLEPLQLFQVQLEQLVQQDLQANKEYKAIMVLQVLKV
jgi:hypothetical protein